MIFSAKKPSVRDKDLRPQREARGSFEQSAKGTNGKRVKTREKEMKHSETNSLLLCKIL